MLLGRFCMFVYFLPDRTSVATACCEQFNLIGIMCLRVAAAFLLLLLFSMIFFRVIAQIVWRPPQRGRQPESDFCVCVCHRSYRLSLPSFVLLENSYRTMRFFLFAFVRSLPYRYEEGLSDGWFVWQWRTKERERTLGWMPGGKVVDV